MTFYKDQENPHRIFDTYFHDEVDKVIFEGIVLTPAKKLLSISDKIKGEILIDASTGQNIAHMIAVVDCFKDIIILEPNAPSVTKMENWRKHQQESYDLCAQVKPICELRGLGEDSQELEEKFREAIKEIVLFDYTNDAITDSASLPKADCLVSVWGLGPVSANQASLRSNVQKLASLVKPGGRLVLFGSINASFFMAGDDKLHTLTCNESNVRTAIQKASCRIESFELLGNVIPKNVIDAENYYCAVAVKENAV